MLHETLSISFPTSYTSRSLFLFPHFIMAVKKKKAAPKRKTVAKKAKKTVSKKKTAKRRK